MPVPAFLEQGRVGSLTLVKSPTIIHCLSLPFKVFKLSISSKMFAKVYAEVFIRHSSLLQ